MTPVYIPSRGRLNSGTLRVLATVPEARVWVHESEIDDYRYAYGERMPLVAHRAEGIGAIRQAMLVDARQHGASALWMIDDDIGPFYWRAGPRHERVAAMVALRLAEEEIAHWPTVAIGGLQPRRWAALAPTPFAMNTHTGGTVWLRTEGPWSYWPRMMEDLDMTLQVLTAGYHALRLNDFAYDTPTLGTTQGGCWDAYQSGQLEEDKVAFQERWGDSIVPGRVATDGTPTPRINRKIFTKPERNE